MPDDAQQIAETIRQQLGRLTCMMIGAKNFGYGKAEDGYLGGLSFKVGQNPKRVTHVEIKLTGLDLYDVRFLNRSTRRKKDPIRVESETKGACVDMLHDLIEQATGLYTRM